MTRFMQAFFVLLYTRLSRFYDYVADVVSFGEWRTWGRCALPHAKGDVLELGFGPGHLHRDLRARGGGLAGVDASRDMARLASRRLAAAGLSSTVCCARAEALPFGAQVFDTVISTFPAPYLYAPATLAGIHRCLRDDGRLVIVPGAELTRPGPAGALIRLVYLVTGQRGPGSAEVRARITARFAEHGFALEVSTTETPNARVTLWVCRKITRA